MNAIDRDLAAAARRHPHRIAVTGAGSGEVAFAAFDRLVDRAAERLAAHGVDRGRFVALELDRSVDAVVCLFALWRLGAAPVPIDPSTPEPFRASLLAPAGGVISHRISSSAPAGEGWELRTVPADRDPDPSAPAPSGGSDAVAYGMFTSGTSGRRRLVVVGHRQLELLRHGLRSTVYAGLEPAATAVALNAPMAFDASLQQLVQLADGATLVLVASEVRGDGHALRRHLRGHGVGALDATPGLVRRWWNQGALSGGERRGGDDGGPLVPRLLVGGEAIDPDLWCALAQVGGMTSFNLYGPTECTVDTMVATISGDRPHLGRPLPGVTVDIEDRGGPVADYVVGELVVGGAGVAWGYAGNGQGGFVDGRYRTGDLVRRHRDGTVEFVGRRDDQVKVAGARVDLSEVDALVRAAPGVTEAVAAVAPDGQLVAVATVVAGSMATGEDLRADVSGRAPLAFVPAEVLVVDAIPLTDRGKVDRLRVASSVADPGGPPQGALETLVAEAMADVAGGDIFRRDESFFRRGGGSLGVLEVVARLADAGYDVEVADVIARPTPRAVAALAKVPDMAVGTATSGGDDRSDRTGPPPRNGSREVPDPADEVDPFDPTRPSVPDAGRVPAGALDLRPVGGDGDAASAVSSASPGFPATTRRSLADAMACGVVAGLDAAALTAVPHEARPVVGTGDDLRALMGGLPMLVQVRRTAIGSLGIVLLPCYDTEVATLGTAPVEMAVRLAATFGARAVSLTGGLAPATDHATTLHRRTAGAIVGTGQASTVAALQATWEAACSAGGRGPAEEHLAVAGTGALIGAFADAVAAGREPPASVRRLDLDRPDTLAGVTSVVVAGVVDHARLLRSLAADVLVVEYATGLTGRPGADGPGPRVISGGSLRPPEAIDDLTFVDDRIAARDPALARQVLDGDSRSIAACALAALLVANAEAPAVRSVPDPSLVAAYRAAQVRCGFGPDLAVDPAGAGRR